MKVSCKIVHLIRNSQSSLDPEPYFPMHYDFEVQKQQDYIDYRVMRDFMIT